MSFTFQDSLFAPSVEVDAADAALALVEADVVEALEAGPVDGEDAVVRDKEQLLPAHENSFLGLGVLDVYGAALSLLRVWPEGGEFVPVVQVDPVGRAPAVVLGEEPVLRSDDLTLEIRCEIWVVFREA